MRSVKELAGGLEVIGPAGVLGRGGVGCQVGLRIGGWGDGLLYGPTAGRGGGN